MTEYLMELTKTLDKRGFETYVCEDSKKAVEAINKILSRGDAIFSIGIGNSVTVKNMGLHQSLLNYTNNIYIHAPVGTEENDRKALTSDYYFTSANAVSLDGHIVNIDGTGNRTSATCFGPKNVIYIIGRNKVTNTLEEALDRARNSAAVKLAEMYNRKTPCVTTGKCEDCISPECICAITTIHRKKPSGLKIIVLLVDEDLGI